MEDGGFSDINGLEYEFGNYVSNCMVCYICGFMMGRYEGKSLTYHQYIKEAYYKLKSMGCKGIPYRSGHYSHERYLKWMEGKDNG